MPNSAKEHFLSYETTIVEDTEKLNEALTLYTSTGIISHKLNNALTIIQSATVALQYYVKDLTNNPSSISTEELQKIKTNMDEMIESILEGCSSIQKTNKGLEDISYINKKRPSLCVVDSLVIQAIRETTSRHSYPSSLIQLHLNIPEKRILYPDLFLFALKQIISNAIDASQKESAPSPIKIESNLSEEHIIIQFINTSINPISDHTIPMFSTPFYSTKLKQGLGLTSTRQIVEVYHKGTLQIKLQDPFTLSVTVKIPFKE